MAPPTQTHNYQSYIFSSRPFPFSTLKGIAIKYKSKYGALLTRTTERGFVIRKLTGPGGEIRWSAPVFLQGSAMGAGLSGGYRKSRTCIALANDQAVQSALRSQSEFGPCVHFLLDMNGTRIKRAHFDSSDQASQTAVSQDRHGGMTAKYYQVDAAMVDISVEGEGWGAGLWNSVGWGLLSKPPHAWHAHRSSPAARPQAAVRTWTRTSTPRCTGRG